MWSLNVENVLALWILLAMSLYVGKKKKSQKNVRWLSVYGTSYIWVNINILV
ncbi:hypothetical protein SAMN04487906_2816 [Zhouia amylolytica]|uniref:Uncharacterized protein n=1 Tax=Zhouia amylolytica TaxID=376730 RepID=A0A1I6V2D1_9FLAO|nr:hypothetical protein SAMN04487906_2816 [Zhouia amylolytica]